MIGAIAGDIIGSVYEFDNIKTTVFPLFTRKSNYTDDTIMTVAVTHWLLYGGNLASAELLWQGVSVSDGRLWSTFRAMAL